MTQAAGEALQGFSRGLTMFFHTAPQGRHPALPPRSGSTSGKQGRGAGGAGPPPGGLNPGGEGDPDKQTPPPRWAHPPLSPPGPVAIPACPGGAWGAGRALVLYSTGSFRVSVTSIRSPSRQISMVT